MKLISWIQVGSLVVGVVACHEVNGPVSPAIPDDVAGFVAPLPNLRSVSAVFSVPDQGFLLFTASYGDPQDCPAGCFYAQSWGIKYAGQIGWIGVSRANGFDPSTARYYDVRSTDQYLFDEALWNRLAKEWIGAEFRVMIACDPDTPPEALGRLALRLPAEGWPFLGDLLVDVAQQRNIRHVAEIISTLGPSSFNFSGTRAHAMAALSTWPSQPTGGYCR